MIGRHLKPAIAALLLLAGGLGGFSVYARRVERRYIHALAPLATPKVKGSKMEMLFPQKNQGSALQREAFRQPDLLPMYGSSELAGYPWDASVIFRTYPTGFTPFPIGWADTTCLTFLQEFAAIGRDIRGKKVVISLSPSWFFSRDMVFPFSYLGNFSALHAGELAWSTDLSFEFKRDAARRMLEYPDTLEANPLLRFALGRLADGSPLSRLVYDIVLPLGKLENLALGLQDHWQTLTYIRAQPGLQSDVFRQRVAPDWSAWLARADEDVRRHSSNNPFGLDNQKWVEDLQPRAAWDKDTRTGAVFLSMLQQTREWVDFDLMLRGLTELGARPLILSMPIDGARYDLLGISASVRRAYYQKLREAVKPYGVPLLDFDDHEADPYFLIDWEEHLSAKGWMHYAKAMDAFYHDQPLDGPVRSASR